jgi:hypothetical protein
LYSPALIIEVMRPSIRTLVSGTNIIKLFLSYRVLWYDLFMLCYSLEFVKGVIQALVRSITSTSVVASRSCRLSSSTTGKIVDTVDITLQG